MSRTRTTAKTILLTYGAEQWRTGGGEMSEQSTIDLKQIDADIEALQLERNKAIHRWLADHCPFKEGDEVVVCGYSHKGKKMRIVRLSVKKDWYDKQYQWVVKGNVLKADGKPGLQTAEFDQSQYEDKR